jgi:hypothetical protein
VEPGEGGPSNTNCPGTGAEPKAASGQFCIYAENTAAHLAFPVAKTSGVIAILIVAGHNSFTFGTYAVTAE